jgi:antitoxin component YwqK of YwqJK toxin-antitoxin module
MEKISFSDGKQEGLEKRYLTNGAVLESQYKNNCAAVGFCVSVADKGIPLTSPEITRLNNRKT